jgi:hypothetical protein
MPIAGGRSNTLHCNALQGCASEDHNDQRVDLIVKARVVATAATRSNLAAAARLSDAVPALRCSTMSRNRRSNVAMLSFMCLWLRV